MDTKFTPGPWNAEGDTVHAMLENGAAVEIAIVNPLGELRTESEYANACLIAAAPELYRALEICLAMASKKLKASMNLKGQSPYDIGVAALAKARGEQP